MSDFFTEVVDDLDGLQQKLLGPDYEYYKQIKAPIFMGMSSNGDLGTMANDIKGLISYTQLLVEGGGNASIVPRPLGNKFFLKTGAKCKDIATNNEVDRSIYINNIPDGSIPFISSGLGVQFTNFRGLVPGMMSNVSAINPLEIFQSFMSGITPDCKEVTMQTVDANNIIGYGSGYVTTTDLKSMNPCWFPNRINPITGAMRGGCGVEVFTNMDPKTDKDTSNKKSDTPQTYINEISAIMTYVYIALTLIVICYLLSRIRTKK